MQFWHPFWFGDLPSSKIKLGGASPKVSIPYRNRTRNEPLQANFKGSPLGRGLGCLQCSRILIRLFAVLSCQGTWAGSFCVQAALLLLSCGIGGAGSRMPLFFQFCLHCSQSSFLPFPGLGSFSGHTGTQAQNPYTHRGARTHEHKVKSLALYRLS